VYTAATDGEVHVDDDDGDDVVPFGASGPGDYSVQGVVGLNQADNVMVNQSARPSFVVSSGDNQNDGTMETMYDRPAAVSLQDQPRVRRGRRRLRPRRPQHPQLPLVGVLTPYWKAGEPHVSPEVVGPGQGTTYLEQSTTGKNYDGLLDAEPWVAWSQSAETMPAALLSTFGEKTISAKFVRTDALDPVMPTGRPVASFTLVAARSSATKVRRGHTATLAFTLHNGTTATVRAATLTLTAPKALKAGGAHALKVAAQQPQHQGPPRAGRQGGDQDHQVARRPLKPQARAARVSAARTVAMPRPAGAAAAAAAGIRKRAGSG
jgi:hypothetical protein